MTTIRTPEGGSVTTETLNYEGYDCSKERDRYSLDECQRIQITDPRELKWEIAGPVMNIV
jgi:hypothetical protein